VVTRPRGPAPGAASKDALREEVRLGRRPRGRVDSGRDQAVKALLVDLDDTLLDYSGGADQSWVEACGACCVPGGISPRRARRDDRGHAAVVLGRSRAPAPRAPEHARRLAAHRGISPP